MPTRTRAGASARTASRRRAPPRKPAPRRKSTRPSRRASRRVTPYGIITVRSGRPLSCTPELTAHARHRYEETQESVYSIATDMGMHPTSFRRMAQRERWVRRNPPVPRDVTDVMRLATAADALVQSAPHPNPLPASGEREHAERAAPLSSDASAVDRLEAAVLKELAAVELMRANLGSEPLRPLEAQVTARTLSVLTETLAKLRRLRLGARPQSGSIENDHDMPADIDEFRRALARRIEAFLESREADEDAERAAGAVVVDQPR